MEIKKEVEKETGKKPKSREPICFLCGRPKKRGNGFGADYECQFCRRPANVGFGKG
jgi:hypothetical protein